MLETMTAHERMVETLEILATRRAIRETQKLRDVNNYVADRVYKAVTNHQKRKVY